MASKESLLSGLSALKDGDPPPYIHPHYKESYRLAIYALLCGGQDAYNDFLQAEQINHFLSEKEICFILENAEVPLIEDVDDVEVRRPAGEPGPSTYFPQESDEEVPDLDLGWPEVTLEDQDTSISLLFHPPRANTPTIKEVVRKQIQDAKQLIAIAMDVFTDVDIFKEVLGATLRGVVVYILLDEAHFGSFHAMSHRAGVNIQDLKNIRVRTVRGQQYRCQSGVKFHGGLEQRFILVDCRSVLYGTYSYTWSFEKINVSMVLVVTGQLVSSYDEEFRRLYARSTVPEALEERSRAEYLRDAALLRSPNSSQLSLHQFHVRSRGTRGLRAQDELLDSPAMMTRGLSMQDRLHLSHFPDHMTRGHSFGGELQRLNSMTRLRMGTKDILPDRSRSGLLVPNRMSHQLVRHQSRYGLDQNLIPFNSETSLHRWKMDTYLNSQVNLDGAYDALSPLTSPYNSRTGLNDHQPPGIHNRSRDIKSRLDEIRQKRLSLQEYNNLRQSQESLRTMYQSLDRPKFKSSLRGLDARQNVAEEDANHKDLDSQPVDDSSGSTLYFDIQRGPEQKASPAYEWYEPLARTTSASQLEDKLKESPLKYPGGLQRPRTMESLIEIPEEKEGCSNPVNSADVLKDRTRNQDNNSKKHLTEKKSGSQETEPDSQELKSPREKETLPKIVTSSEVKGHHREDSTLQRKNSTRVKSSEEKKTSKKEEKSLQRKASLRSQNSSTSNSRASPVGKTATEHRSSQNSIGRSTADSEKPKSSFTFHRFSSQRSSKRKSNPATTETARENPEEQQNAAYESRREKAYSRYEYLLHSSVPRHKAKRGDGVQLSDNDPAYQTHAGGADNKLGRFMQRVGNLIGKNK
ncbi:protein FAM83B-like [Syngnathus acus]|uniref:protein FAM83B-like n=1 Tax=Syngnathus acus TaxID=161584 RepID=UPI001885B49D|nr:protein FAM83B-like [Syngnathus acus]XP_037136468.1 protein FAM83B-like [Syngnathus acus]